jgi:diguanylate cyclase (GGDEF)-like protein
VQGEPFYDENGQPAGFVSTFTDITSLKETETALNVTVDRLQTLIDYLPSAVTLFDGELRLVAWNRQLLKLLDFPPELIAEGVSLEQLVRYNIARGEYGEIRDPEDYVARFLEVARQFRPHEFERVRPNGQVLHIVGQPVPSGGFVTIYTDVTRERQAEAELQRLAVVDELTGLANRTALLAQLPRMCQEARRRHERLAVLLVDLDRFKWINDSAGHEAGDQLLQEAARRITSVVRSSDLAARLGGDEFAIVAPSAQPLQVADLAKRLLAALAHPFTLAAGTWQIGASIGIALFPDDEENASALLRAADLAMQLAKGEGGNTYAYFTRQLQELAQSRAHLEQRLRLAVLHNAFSLVYQPIVDRAGCTVSAETLLRWEDEELGFVSPAHFIPFAEQMGLMPSIGQWVLAQGIEQLAQWDRAGLVLPTLSINLSVHQLYDAELVTTVRELLAAHRIDPSRLILEITETAMMQDPELAKQRIMALSRLGIRFAVDDFGTGYSSLTYLHAFPLAELKIDRSFVAPLASDDGDETIIDATIQIAHRLGLSVVAEGVENEAQRQRLIALGCDLFQGYHFARPLTSMALAEWLAARREPSAF